MKERTEDKLKRKRYISYIIGCLLAAFLLAYCGGRAAESSAVQIKSIETSSEGKENGETPVKETAGDTAPEREAASVTFTDALGREVTIDGTERTAVFSGSFADAWALAGGTLTTVTEDAVDMTELPEGCIVLGSLKNPDMELLMEADIDFVILSSAISEHVALSDTLERAGIKHAYFEVETFGDYKNMMDILTDITGRKDLYGKYVQDVEKEIEEQLQRADTSSPSVLFLRAYSTGVRAKGNDSMTGGMLKELGCVNIADSDNGLLKDLSMEAVMEAEPDYIFVTTMGESKEAALEMVQELLIDNPAWKGLKAVKENHYYVLPKELFHNKPNERWGESYRMLADYLYGK